MLYFIVKYLLGPFFLLALRPVVYGRKNLQVSGKAIFVCNHRSMLDPVLIALISPRVVHFMAKKELFSTWIGRLFFKSVFVLPVNRKNVDLQSLKESLKVLNSGKVFGIFPEGKRAVTDSLDEFERGAAFLAIRSGAPVIPIYIHHSSYKSYRPVMVVGKAIDISRIVAAANKSTLIDVVTDEIADAVDALRVNLEEED